MYHRDKDQEACKLVRDVTMDEDRLDLLDEAIEKEKAYLAELLKSSSQLKKDMACNKSALADEIEAMEKVEVETHRTALRLSAYSVERSRLVRTIMRTNSDIRIIGHEVNSSDEDDPDVQWELEQMHEMYWAKTDVCMGKKSELEQHVEKEGEKEIAFILSLGRKAKVDERLLLSARQARDRSNFPSYNV